MGWTRTVAQGSASRGNSTARETDCVSKGFVSRSGRLAKTGRLVMAGVVVGCVASAAMAETRWADATNPFECSGGMSHPEVTCGETTVASSPEIGSATAATPQIESTSAPESRSTGEGGDPVAAPALGSGLKEAGETTTPRGTERRRNMPMRVAEGTIQAPCEIADPAAGDTFEVDASPDRDLRSERRLTSTKTSTPRVEVDEDRDTDRRGGQARPSRGSRPAPSRPPVEADDEETANPSWAFALRNISRLLDL